MHSGDGWACSDSKEADELFVRTHRKMWYYRSRVARSNQNKLRARACGTALNLQDELDGRDGPPFDQHERFVLGSNHDILLL